MPIPIPRIGRLYFRLLRLHDEGLVVARMRLSTNEDKARDEEAKDREERTIPGMGPLSSLLLLSIVVVGRCRRWVPQFSFIRFRFCRVISKKERRNGERWNGGTVLASFGALTLVIRQTITIDD